LRRGGESKGQREIWGQGSSFAVDDEQLAIKLRRKEKIRKKKGKSRGKIAGGKTGCDPQKGFDIWILPLFRVGKKRKDQSTSSLERCGRLRIDEEVRT